MITAMTAYFKLSLNFNYIFLETLGNMHVGMVYVPLCTSLRSGVDCVPMAICVVRDVMELLTVKIAVMKAAVLLAETLLVVSTTTEQTTTCYIHSVCGYIIAD